MQPEAPAPCPARTPGTDAAGTADLRTRAGRPLPSSPISARRGPRRLAGRARQLGDADGTPAAPGDLRSDLGGTGKDRDGRRPSRGEQVAPGRESPPGWPGRGRGRSFRTSPHGPERRGRSGGASERGGRYPALRGSAARSRGPRRLLTCARPRACMSHGSGLGGGERRAEPSGPRRLPRPPPPRPGRRAAATTVHASGFSTRRRNSLGLTPRPHAPPFPRGPASPLPAPPLCRPGGRGYLRAKRSPAHRNFAPRPARLQRPRSSCAAAAAAVARAFRGAGRPSRGRRLRRDRVANPDPTWRRARGGFPRRPVTAGVGSGFFSTRRTGPQRPLPARGPRGCARWRLPAPAFGKSFAPA